MVFYFVDCYCRYFGASDSLMWWLFRFVLLYGVIILCGLHLLIGLGVCIFVRKNVMGFEAKVVVVCDTEEEFVNRVERGVFDLVFCRVPADCPRDAGQADAMSIVDTYWRSVSNAVQLVKDGGYVVVNNELPIENIRSGLYFNREVMKRHDVCCVAKVKIAGYLSFKQSESLVTVFRRLTSDEIVYRNHSLHELGLMSKSKRQSDWRWVDFKGAYVRVHEGFKPVGSGVLPFVETYSEVGLGLYMFYKDMIRAFSDENGAVVDLGEKSVYLAEKCVEMGRKVCIVRKERPLVDRIKSMLDCGVLEVLRSKEEHDNIPVGCYNVSECLSVSIRNRSNRNNDDATDKKHKKKKSAKRRTKGVDIEQTEETPDEAGCMWINDKGDEVWLPYGKRWKPDRVEKRAYQTDFSDIPF